MLAVSPQPSNLTLSICITTFNRSAFICATLDSILAQLTDDCEIVVLDGGSTDDTEQVLSEYTQRVDRLRYVRQDVNNGFDRDCDRTVELARGEYCWLMTDDDLLKPGAVAAVLKVLRRDLSLIIVNAEARDLSMLKVLQPRWLDIDSDRVYAPGEMDQLFADVGYILEYVGCVVIKRAVWLARERQRYYGSWFIFVGVIFQEPLPGEAMVIAEPFISYRRGNSHVWSSHRAEIIFLKWPSLLRSLPISESARRSIRSAEPWRNLQWLLLLRGGGLYSMREYQRWVRPQLRSIREKLTPTLVAVLPGVLVNALFVCYFSMATSRLRDMWLPNMKESRFYLPHWRVFKP